MLEVPVNVVCMPSGTTHGNTLVVCLGSLTQGLDWFGPKTLKSSDAKLLNIDMQQIHVRLLCPPKKPVQAWPQTKPGGKCQQRSLIR